MKLTYAAQLACLIAALLCGCAPTANWWAMHPDQFLVSARYQTSEPAFDRPRAPEAPPRGIKIPVVIQNDSMHAIYFAKYDSNASQWVGGGTTLQLAATSDAQLKIVDIDYSSLSGVTILPGGDTGKLHAAWISVEPSSNLFQAGKINKAVLAVKVTWELQDQDGIALPVKRTTTFYPELIFIGELAPVIVSAGGH